MTLVTQYLLLITESKVINKDGTLPMSLVRKIGIGSVAERNKIHVEALIKREQLDKQELIEYTYAFNMYHNSSNNYEMFEEFIMDEIQHDDALFKVIQDVMTSLKNSDKLIPKTDYRKVVLEFAMAISMRSESTLGAGVPTVDAVRAIDRHFIGGTTEERMRSVVEWLYSIELYGMFDFASWKANETREVNASAIRTNIELNEDLYDRAEHTFKGILPQPMPPEPYYVIGIAKPKDRGSKRRFKQCPITQQYSEYAMAIPYSIDKDIINMEYVPATVYGKGDNEGEAIPEWEREYSAKYVNYNKEVMVNHYKNGWFTYLYSFPDSRGRVYDNINTGMKALKYCMTASSKHKIKCKQREKAVLDKYKPK